MKRAEVNFQNAQTVVQYDSSKVTVKEMIELLTYVGYRASVP